MYRTNLFSWQHQQVQIFRQWSKLLPGDLILSHILFANDLSPKMLILFPYRVLCICKHYNIILQLQYHNFFTGGSQHILQLLSKLALQKWIISKWRSLKGLNFLKVKSEVQRCKHNLFMEKLNNCTFENKNNLSSADSMVRAMMKEWRREIANISRIGECWVGVFKSIQFPYYCRTMLL